jgi:Zn finger protein HypA/HybF involved in hydrogenase expression
MSLGKGGKACGRGHKKLPLVRCLKCGFFFRRSIPYGIVVIHCPRCGSSNTHIEGSHTIQISRRG